MSMQQEHNYILEQSRNDKVRNLGFLCYNLYVDGVIVFPEMNGIAEDIKRTLNYAAELKQNNTGTDYLHMQEAALNEKLTELGCICYNLYVDSKLFNSNVLSLCDSISSINYEITNGLKISSQDEYPGSRHIGGRRNATQSKLKVTCPYGMEPIPSDFKRCMCGYRNRSEARFCGKCGAKLS